MCSGSYIPAKPVDEMKMGIDLGQANDSTAIMVVRKIRRPIAVVDGDASTLSPDLRQKLGPAKFFVEYAKRLPLGMGYVEQAQFVKALWMEPKYRRCEIVGDRTGVGRAALDIFTAMFNMPVTRVSITSGRVEGKDKDGSLTVPKVELLSALFAVFQKKALNISPTLADFKEIMLQMQNLHAQLTPGGSVTYNAAGSFHDDFCIAAALALYRLEPVTTGHRWSATDLSKYIS